MEPATEVRLVKSRLIPARAAVWVTALPQSALIKSPAVHWVSKTKSRKVPVVVGSMAKASVTETEPPAFKIRSPEVLVEIVASVMLTPAE